MKVVKNKVAPPFREAEFDILYGEGISREGDLLDLAVDRKIVDKSGTWFAYSGERLGQGRENAKQFLRDNPEHHAGDRGSGPQGTGPHAGRGGAGCGSHGTARPRVARGAPLAAAQRRDAGAHGDWPRRARVDRAALVRARLRSRLAMAAFQVILAVTLAGVVPDAVVKPLTARPRPFVASAELPVLRERPGGYSFPSGHAATAVAGAYSLSAMWPAARPFVGR